MATRCIAASVVLLVVGCGGGGNSSTDAGVQPDSGFDDPRLVAVEATAMQHPSCKSLGDFYWSVGDAGGAIGHGQIGSEHGATSRMPIFSASKLVFAAYVVEDSQGSLTPALIAGLNFTSGFVEQGLKLCVPSDTVGSCFVNELNNYQAAKAGTFNYASGHMQKIAAMELGLGGLDRPGFAAEIMSELGTDLELEFHVALTIGGTPVTAGPVAAGGMNTTPAAYERFLTRVVAGELRIREHLGTHAVATTLPAVGYSLGHWVEHHPDASTDAYSSVGALGFYPWVDAAKAHWGILARVELRQDRVGNAAADSQACGQWLRRAFETGVAQR